MMYTDKSKNEESTLSLKYLLFLIHISMVNNVKEDVFKERDKVRYAVKDEELKK